MTGSSAIKFGRNRGTHWTVAGAVAVIILGSYLIYSNHGSGPTPTLGEAAGTPAPTAPGSSTLKK
jgi:hypothetical protein